MTGSTPSLIQRCPLCDTVILYVLHGRIVRVTGHDSALCRTATMDRIRRLQAELQSARKSANAQSTRAVKEWARRVDEMLRSCGLPALAELARNALIEAAVIGLRSVEESAQ